MKLKSESRQSAIKELITTHPVENQQTLVELLKARYGIETNQSIISRDLHTLGVTKQPYKDTSIYELRETDASKEILRLCVTHITHNESLIVITVLAGLAGFVGDYLDAHKDDVGILGTIAGENMIFVAPISTKNIKGTVAAISQLLYFKGTL